MSLLRYIPNSGQTFAITVGQGRFFANAPFAYYTLTARVTYVVPGRVDPVSIFLNLPSPGPGENSIDRGRRQVSLWDLKAEVGYSQAISIILEPHGASWSVSGGLVTFFGTRAFCPCCPLPTMSLPGASELLSTRSERLPPPPGGDPPKELENWDSDESDWDVPSARAQEGPPK